MPVTDGEAFHILLASSASIYSAPLHNHSNSLTELFFLWEDEQLVMTATRILQHLTRFNFLVCKKKKNCLYFFPTTIEMVDTK